jgi:pimeloyl-ACP methyl ester carboxylesterase
MIPMLKAFAGSDLRHVLPAIDVPVLLVYGERDVRSPLTVAEELHRSIPGSKLVVVEGSGHLVNAEAPEQFNAAVVDFLRSIDGSPVS